MVKVEHPTPQSCNRIGWRHERWWVSLTGCRDHLTHIWHQNHLGYNVNWLKTTQSILKDIHHWSKSHPENLKHKIKSLWDQLQAAYSSNNHTMIQLLHHDLDKALIQQEDYWKQ